MKNDGDSIRSRAEALILFELLIKARGQQPIHGLSPEALAAAQALMAQFMSAPILPAEAMTRADHEWLRKLGVKWP